MYVKICGLSTIESARVALDAGADAVGVVMSRRSRRTVSADIAREIAGFVGGAADVVLVVDELPAVEAASVAGGIGADVVQLHGTGYRPDDVAAAAGAGLRVWRATSVTSADEVDVGSWGEEALLLDSPDPGSGRRWDFAVLEGRPLRGRWMLAGGLDPENIAEAVASARPWGVDVSSGVESAPGVKDLDRIRAFVAAAKAV
ncbi:phosphoribosylanthranilate isomerase [Leifsonia naganoensis]|uniref:N-(5'-phosphoribosyl)anthranilate isomerase n=1 Tax=Leifsonia naganoensis TaxID=150025 RepID=A0A853DRN4_9MICO|nr:phosphoribosylanthranilate isomerase [Leifsonia naganoensis]NYK10129.1 phosphoribosylanthranilate isomerase [Leifsonia naganoensis]